MAKVMGWSPTEMREREDAFAALVDAQVEKVTRKVAAVMAGDRVVVAAGGTPTPPVDLGSIGVITGLWHQSVAAEIIFVSASLGHLLQVGRDLNDPGQMIGIMLVIIAIGMVVDRVLFGTMERWVNERWGMAR